MCVCVCVGIQAGNQEIDEGSYREGKEFPPAASSHEGAGGWGRRLPRGGRQLGAKDTTDASLIGLIFAAAAYELNCRDFALTQLPSRTGSRVRDAVTWIVRLEPREWTKPTDQLVEACCNSSRVDEETELACRLL